MFHSSTLSYQISIHRLRTLGLVDDEMHRIGNEINAQISILMTSSQLHDDPCFMVLYRQVIKTMRRITNVFSDLITGNENSFSNNPAYFERYAVEIEGLASMSPLFYSECKYGIKNIDGVPPKIWQALTFCMAYAYEIIEASKSSNCKMISVD